MSGRNLHGGLVALLFCAVLIAGCGDDNGTSQPNVPFPYASDPENLMQDFRIAYNEMNLTAYRNALHPDFNFVLQAQDVAHLGMSKDYLTREEDLEVADNIFNGGGLEPVLGIHIDAFEPMTQWQDMPSHTDFPGTMRRVYRVLMAFERAGSTTLEIDGLQEFFVASRDTVMPNGTSREFWQIRGQMDRTEGGCWKATENMTWGCVKGAYR
jgi:hypothetical protein